MDPASHRWHVWTPLHSGLNATASNRWHVHLAQASTRTHLALGEPKPHRGPAHLGLARCGSTTADANAWSSIHKTSAPWTNSTTGTSSPHDQQSKSCWCIVQDLVRIVPLNSAHWPRTVTSLPRGSNPASNSNRGTCDASRSHRSVHTAGPSQIASSTHQQLSPIMAFRARSLPIKGSRFVSKLITSHCSAAIAPVTASRPASC